MFLANFGWSFFQDRATFGGKFVFGPFNSLRNKSALIKVQKRVLPFIAYLFILFCIRFKVHTFIVYSLLVGYI